MSIVDNLYTGMPATGSHLNEVHMKERRSEFAGFGDPTGGHVNKDLMTISNYYENENPKIGEINLGRSQYGVDDNVNLGSEREYDVRDAMGNMGMNPNRNNYL